jgi:hypothetical protein
VNKAQMSFFERLQAEIGRRLRSPAFSRFFIGLGIDSKRYWLLMDLFHKLSSRDEMQGQLGRQSRALKFSALFFFYLSGGATVLLLLFKAPALPVLEIFTVITAFFLVTILLSETANSLVNPDEALTLAHQPINGATYTAAKLSHLLSVVVHYVLGLNLLPALASPLLKDGRWFSPLLHLSAAFATGLFLAMFCCSIFGWLIRVVPARRIKSVAQFVQALPIFLFSIARFSPRGTMSRVFAWFVLTFKRLAALPDWLALLMAIVILGAVTLTGLRSLSGDYLIRVSSMVHGSSHVLAKERRSLLGRLVRHLFGGQVSRAGFDYVLRMMSRDWQFRRQLLQLLPMSIFAVIGIVGGSGVSPFSGRFSSIHFLPHFFGFILFGLCMFLQYGTDYKGVWLFLCVSDSALPKVARGVHASLWLTLVIVPHLALLILFTWRWMLSEGLLFTAYSLAVTTIYLACGLRFIDGIPFGKQLNPGRGAGMQGGFIAFIIAAMVAVGIQYLLFRSLLTVVVATVLAGGAAYVVTQRSLKHFENAMRYNLGIISQTSTMIYTEATNQGIFG